MHQTIYQILRDTGQRPGEVVSLRTGCIEVSGGQHNLICTEPSNVKAGGGACPIRFQCAGCGFYRPAPSYLPALEQHIASLRADRETAQAMDAAD